MSVAEAFVTVRPDMDRFGGELRSGLGRMAGIAASAGLAIGAGIAAAGVAAFKVGETFDDAFDTIRVGTGATGKALEGLQGSFREVVRNVPTDFESASTAIADLNTRLGVTGKPLEQLSGQFLELARITDTDVSSSIASVTRVFGDWAVKVEDQSGTLDQLFRASQATGIGVDDLASKLVQFGAPLRQMGFGFEEATALLASFEREGVNAELVMGSMRIALGEFAREGVTDTKAALEELITAIAAAGSEGEATALAMEYFGARAGADMAAAIREGRFSVDELVATISNGSETVLKAAEDTRDFAESWQQFKNNVLLALEPVAIRVFDAIGAKMDQFLEWWQTNGPTVIARIGEVRDWFVRLGDRIAAWWKDDAKPAIDAFVAAMNEHWPKVEILFETLGETVSNIADIFRSEVDNMSTATEEGESSMSEDIGSLLDTLNVLAETVQVITAGISRAWAFLSVAVTGDFGRMGSAMDDFTGGALSRFGATVGAKIREVTRWFANMPGAIAQAVGNLGRLLWAAGRDVVQGFIDGVTSQFRRVQQTFRELTSRLPDWKGPENVDKTLLRGPAFTIMEGFADDLMRAANAEVMPTLQRLTGDMSRTGLSPTKTSSPAAGDVHVHISQVPTDAQQTAQLVGLALRTAM